MSKIVECVPNFSEGRDHKIIEAIADAIRSSSGVTLLDVDSGASTNRTVYTFVGSPENTVQAALNAARKASELIDMRKQKGEHPRLGAMDVCPFIPVRNVTMDDCVQCAEKLAALLADNLSIPVYLYGNASKADYRRAVPQIRSGEYEGLAKKLEDSQWRPDFGPVQFVPNWGASIVGARSFLIAYNVNLISTKEQAHKIALNIRELGRGPEERGRLRCCQAIGWTLTEERISQVTINLTDYHVTPIHVAFEQVKADAEKYSLPVIGSQIVGLVPLESMLMAADYYIQRDNLLILEEEHKIRLVIDRLGLSSLGNFNPRERIIDYQIEDKQNSLVGLSVEHFVEKVGERSGTPGGGSVAALVASLGAGLAAMVSKLAYGKKIFETNEKPMRELIPVFHHAMKEMLAIVDEDTSAFERYSAAFKLPKKTDDEKTRRSKEIQASLENAISVPLRLARIASKLWQPLLVVTQLINMSTMSDLQVAVGCLKSGILGAYYNVIINLDSANQFETRDKIESEIKNLKHEAEEWSVSVLQALEIRRISNK